MAIYQGTPLPRTRRTHTQPKRAVASPRIPDRPPVPVRNLSRPATPAHGVASRRTAVARGEPVQRAARLLTIAAPRSRTALAGMATVLVVTFVALFYLSQIFEAAAARYEVQQLDLDRQVMLQELQTQQGKTLGLGSVGRVMQWAQDHGLEPLREPIQVPAR